MKEKKYKCQNGKHEEESRGSDKVHVIYVLTERRHTTSTPRKKSETKVYPSLKKEKKTTAKREGKGKGR